MRHAAILRELLAPMGIYDLNARYNGSELEAQGLALDEIFDTLEEFHREGDLTTAESWGLEELAGLLARRPVTTSPQRLRESLTALLRVGGDSFTVDGINEAISGCGIIAQVAETGERGMVEVSFPEIPGIPEGFEEISKIIEELLPAHLEVTYVYWYVTWEELERKIASWQDIEDQELTWKELETLVY